MTDANNNQARARSFERHTKELVQELDYLGKNVRSCPGFHGWVVKQHPQADRKEGLNELATAIENFAKSLRFLLSGNKFWMSETVTDRSGVRDLKEFKPEVEALELRLASIMESQGQAYTLKDLRVLTSEVDGMAQKFEKLREDMLLRILDKASHANARNEETEAIPLSSSAPRTQEKEETASEPDPAQFCPPHGLSFWVRVCLMIFVFVGAFSLVSQTIASIRLHDQETLLSYVKPTRGDSDYWELLSNSGFLFIGSFFSGAVILLHIREHKDAEEWFAVWFTNFICLLTIPLSIKIYVEYKWWSKAISCFGGSMQVLVNFLALLNLEELSQKKSWEGLRAQRIHDRKEAAKKLAERDKLSTLERKEAIRQLAERDRELEELRAENERLKNDQNSETPASSTGEQDIASQQVEL